MHFYAQELRFEEAKELRDRIEKIQKSGVVSDIDFASKENYDIFVVRSNDTKAVVVKVFMREGKIISSDATVVLKRENYDATELLQRSIVNFYAYTNPPIVAPIVTNIELEEKQLLEEYLRNQFGKKLPIIFPKRGAKKQLIDLALLNADEVLRQEGNKKQIPIEMQLQELLQLQHLPQRIECFDNSHMAGKATVGAMICWENGAFEKQSYRHYHLEAKNEYDQMKELLMRRIESFATNPPPDLWVIDGGATLLKLAYDLIQSSGVNVDVIAIAKEKVDAKAHRAKGKAKDILFTIDTELQLQSSDVRLQFIQRLRDEAHRFAITFHQKVKLKQDQESKLLTLHGISEAKVKKLISYFGTFEAIKKGSFEEISTILNKKDAKIIENLYR
jgi:excinuclease ABC subunit C